jgi:hypothetical protein
MSPLFFSRGKIGIDGNRPIDVSSGALAPQVSDPGIIAALGAAFVRLNFVLGPWSSPRDSTLHAGRTWYGAYDTLVNAFAARGVGVYGLIGAEAVPTDPGDRLRNAGANTDADAWLQTYTANFRDVVSHFAGRVNVFESFNEPNDWHGGSSAWIHPYWFAKMLRNLYQATRIDAGLQITLVSGPLLSHDLPGGGDDGTTYLDQTYRQGRTAHNWEGFQAEHGTYPLDGIGYHTYLGESPGSTTAAIGAAYSQYLAAIGDVITRYEGQLTQKGLHVSEFGWSSDPGEDWQSRNMQTGYRLLRDHARVQSACWFCVQDFPGKTYGVYRTGGLGAAQRKQSYATYQALAAESVPTTQVGYDAQGRFYAPIAAAYDRNGGKAVLGDPYDNGGGAVVHAWGAGVVQDFRTADGAHAIIMLATGASVASMLRGIIRHRYLYSYGGATGRLGYPAADQGADEWGLPRARFEHGEIGCRAFVTYQEA